MITSCWRCKQSFDTRTHDVTETVGLCKKCWDESSVEKPVDLEISPAASSVMAQVAEEHKKAEEHIFKVVGLPDVTVVAQTLPTAPSALETRVAAEVTADLPRPSGVDFVALQKQNDPSTKQIYNTARPFGGPDDKERFQEELTKKLLKTMETFSALNVDDPNVREKVRNETVKTLLENVPLGMPKPPKKLVERFVDDVFDRTLGKVEIRG